MRATTRPTQTKDAPRSRPTMAVAKRCRRGAVTSPGADRGGSSAAETSPSPEGREQRDLVAGREHPVAASVHAVHKDDARGTGLETETLDDRAHGVSLGQEQGVLRAALRGLRLEAG